MSSLEDWTDQVARIKAAKEGECVPDVDPVLADISCRLTRVADRLGALGVGPPADCDWNFAKRRCNRCGLDLHGNRAVNRCPALEKPR